MPSLVGLEHCIFQVHSFQHCAHPRKQKIVYNKPTTKQKSKNKGNHSGYHTGDEPNIACVDTVQPESIDPLGRGKGGQTTTPIVHRFELDYQSVLDT